MDASLVILVGDFYLLVMFWLIVYIEECVMEKVMAALQSVVKNDGREERFDVAKMVKSMRLAANKTKVNGQLKEQELGKRVLEGIRN